MPPSRRASTPSTVTITGTGFSECAVFGLPSGSSMWSALPWSAVIDAARRRVAWTAATTSPRHASTVSTAVDRRRDHAGVADHVGVGEVDDRRSAGSSSRHALDERVGGLARAHLAACGRRSARRAARAPARAARRATGASSPPLKKYVTCGYFSVSATCSWRAPARGEHLARASSPGARAGTRPGRASPPRTRSASRSARPTAGAAAVDLAEAGLGQRARDLAHPVGAEVERDHAVAGADPRLVADDRRLR